MSNATQGSLCIHCKQRPKYVEGSKTHDCCGRGCAAKAKLDSNPAPLKGMCRLCRGRPVWGSYEFCGKTCGTKACIVCKCRNKHHDAKTGVTHCYCSKTCAWKGSQGVRKVASNAPCIIELDLKSPEFGSIVKQFNASWRHPTPLPTVSKVYQVVSPPSAMQAYEAYRQGLEDVGNFQGKGKSVGNEERRWHGTKRACRLGDSGYNQLCSDATCSLCNIIRESYDLKRASRGWGRFGRGIYTSSTSSKSDAPYAKNIGKAVYSQYKAMLLNKVAVGQGYKTLTDMPHLIAPPNGYDSVLGEVGVSLNYDELTVYRCDAIIPAYLVIYGC